MLIQIIGPVFRCKDDEAVFLSRLYELSNYKNISQKGLNFHLTLTNNPIAQVFEELQAICNIWGTSFVVLEE
jgi:hypothetical protein